jgi:hypothetical protein
MSGTESLFYARPFIGRVGDRAPYLGIAWRRHDGVIAAQVLVTLWPFRVYPWAGRMADRKHKESVRELRLKWTPCLAHGHSRPFNKPSPLPFTCTQCGRRIDPLEH